MSSRSADKREEEEEEEEEERDRERARERRGSTLFCFLGKEAGMCLSTGPNRLVKTTNPARLLSLCRQAELQAGGWALPRNNGEI